MKYKQMCKRLFGVFCALLLLVAVIGGQSVLPAFAATSSYTSPLEDLQKDSEFNVNDYPDNAGDYSIQVIQIAESTDGELFVYTYQSCQKTAYLVATEINMGLSENLDEEIPDNSGDTDNGNETGGDSQGGGGFGGGGGRPCALVVEEKNPVTKLYGLTLLKSSGVFCKYKVNGFTISEEAVRCYNITSIYREWIKGIDEETGNDNTKDAVAFAVGKCYKATTVNGEVTYSCEERKTIEIINPYADFLRYTDGFFLKTTACDSHYVAFSTDMNIDELYEADLAYQSRSVHYYHKAFVGGVTDYGEWQSHYAFLTDEQEFIKDRTGWLWGTEKKYNRIQRVADFFASEKLTDETKENLKGKEWILRFAETDCTFNYDGSDQGNNYWSEVSNVTILRLKFKSAGTVYNLGAVSDKVTGDNKPGNVVEGFDFWQYVWNCVVKLFTGTANFAEAVVAVIAILVVLVLFPLAIFILSMVFPAFGAVIKAIFKGLWWLICLPFKGIAALVRKIRGE